MVVVVAPHDGKDNASSQRIRSFKVKQLLSLVFVCGPNDPLVQRIGFLVRRIKRNDRKYYMI